MTDEITAFNPASPANPPAELAPLAGLAGDVSPPARGADGRFLSGNSGGGRPKGSRNRLTEVFMSAIADDFAQHGADAIERIRREDPTAYVRIVGSFVPRELVVQRESEPAFDLDSLSFSDFMTLLEQAKRRHSVRRALMDAEPPAFPPQRR